MSFEIDPPDEPCPDCGSGSHRECQVLSRKELTDEIEDIRDKAFVIIEELWTKEGILVKRRVGKGPWEEVPETRVPRVKWFWVSE